MTSAVELDPELVQRIGSEIEKQTGQTVELQSDVDARHPRRHSCCGSGNKVLDASVRNRLDKLRKSVAARRR